FGTNNCDHQARICHSTTVAGVANTWGYGAMTNSYNDMQNSKCAMYIGSNAAEAHPVSLLHMLHAKETGCKMIVVDPRFTRTAAKADEYVRIRSGSDVAFLWGMLHHIFKNGWEDKQYIHDRVYGMDKVKEEVMAKWTPDKVEEVCGVPEARVLEIATLMAKNKPSTLVWCMGQTQHTIGNAMVRASCIVQLTLGNIGVSGGGANIFRGHDNVQGATDVGPNPDSLPGYYGLAAGSWKHYAAVWGVDYEWIKKQYAEGMMEKPGMTVSRWIDGVLEKNDQIDQGPNLRERVIRPLFESQTDQAIMYAFAKKFGFGNELCKNYKIWKPDGDAKFDEPTPEDILREINRSNWTIGYTGQSPERLKLHMKNQNTFDVKTLRAKGGPCDGDYYGLPWPCYGTPEIKHPGSPNLYDESRHVMDGGGCFRANFGIERDGVNLLAEDGSFPKGSELTTGYPEFDHVLLKKLGWWDDLTDAEKKAAEGKNWKTDLSGGIQRVA